MLPDKDLSQLCDEDYLVQRAKESQNVDPCAAKSWMITAQALFPQNFGIQFEVYQTEKTAKNVKEAAKCLGVMLREFPHEAVLWREIDVIMAALGHSSPDTHSSFLNALFNMLPKEVQLSMVVSAAERSQDTMSRCRLMLLLTTTFPETTAVHGLQLVESLTTAEKHCPTPLNPFRKMLVCELLPRLLQTEGLEVRPKTLHSLLTTAIEFYITYVTTPHRMMQGVVDCGWLMDDPWQRLFSVVQLIGWNLGWDLVKGFQSTSNREVIMQRIQNLIEGGARLGGPKGEGGEDVREVLYTTLTIFLHALMDYTKRLYPDFNQESTTTTSTPNTTPAAATTTTNPPMTLVEAFIHPDVDPPQESTHAILPARPRPSIEEDPSVPIITVSRPAPTPGPSAAVGGGGMSVGGGLSQALTTAIKCWVILNSYEQLRSEFMRVLESLGSELWWWLRVFTVDVLIYQGRLPEAASDLQHSLAQHHSPLQPTALVSTNLKLASVYYAMNNLSGAAEAVLEVVRQVGGWACVGGLSSHLTVSAPAHHRHLHILALTRPQCLQFSTTLLIHALRQRVVVDRHMDDFCIGHLITLLQYEWPRYASTFDEVLQVIKKQGGFSYPLFSSYVTVPDILEEFMYLATKEGGNLQLDIIPVTQANKQQRTISTRGVDRDLKQDFKLGMKKLMLRSFEPIETTIITFLTREGSLIHENLM